MFTSPDVFTNYPVKTRVGGWCTHVSADGHAISHAGLHAHLDLPPQSLQLINNTIIHSITIFMDYIVTIFTNYIITIFTDYIITLFTDYIIAIFN